MDQSTTPTTRGTGKSMSFEIAREAAALGTSRPDADQPTTETPRLSATSPITAEAPHGRKD